MNGTIAFLKKEFLEQLRSFKLLVLLAVLFLIGMTSPLMAKLMPDIFSKMSIQGITVTIPAPTVLDAYAQFFKNVSQMGLLVLLLVFSGMLSQELSRGTLAIPLAKGLSRHAVIVSKYIAATVTWTLGYAMAAAVNYGYTVYLFGSFSLPHLFFSQFCLWLFGAFLLALLLLAGTAASGGYGGLLLTAAGVAVLLTAQSIPSLQKWNPVTLAAGGNGLLTNGTDAGSMMVTVWITLALTALCLLCSLFIFRKKML
jgi:ABC-2 type transport system permease protein